MMKKTTRNHAKNSENVSNKLLTQCTSVFPKSNSSAEQFSSRCATIKQVMNDERGIGTLEIVIIIAVLLAVALLFREITHGILLKFNQQSFRRRYFGRILENAVRLGHEEMIW